MAVTNQKIYGDVTKTIGNTPLVKLNRVTAGAKAEVAVKLESRNPGGSVLTCATIVFSVITGRKSLGHGTSSLGSRPCKMMPGRTISRCISGKRRIVGELATCLIGI